MEQVYLDELVQALLTLIWATFGAPSVLLKYSTNTAERMAEPHTSQSIADGASFSRYFHQTVNEIQNLIEKIGTTNIATNNRNETIEQCLTDIARLAKEVTDASSFLPAYDQRTYSEAVKGLTTGLQAARQASVPKQKFSFKSKPRFNVTTTKRSGVGNEQDASPAALASREDSRSQPAVSYGSGFTSHTTTSSLRSGKGAIQTLPEITAPGPSRSTDLSHASQLLPSQVLHVDITDSCDEHRSMPDAVDEPLGSGTVMRIQRSVVDLWAPDSTDRALTSLTVKDVTSSLIICGLVNGPIHLTNVVDSVIIVSSRQFRMHASNNTDVYLLNLSRPIIEDCSAIRFAPLPATYMSVQDEKPQNQWMDVDDFKWLKHDQSPNWSILESSKRVSEQIWQKLRLEGPNAAVEKTLAVMGIKVS